MTHNFNTDTFTHAKKGIDFKKKESEPEWARTGAFVVHVANFALSLAFSIYLLWQAFLTDPFVDRPGARMVHKTCVLASTVQNSSTFTPAASYDLFTNVLLGVEGDPVEVKPVPTDADFFRWNPRVWRYLSADSGYSLTELHSSFLMFAGLWMSSSFAICTTPIKVFDKAWGAGFSRVVVAMAWNCIGAILVLILHFAPGGWGRIPLSNTVTALGMIALGSIYQYFHMTEIDKDFKETETGKYLNEFTWVRRALYLEFAITFPLFLLAALSTGAEGIEQWRVQVSFLSVYTFFSLLGLLERWRHLGEEISYSMTKLTTVIHPDKDPEIVNKDENPIRNAGWYLVYGIALCFCATANAVNTYVYTGEYAQDLATGTLARLVVMYILIVMAFIVLGFVAAQLYYRFEAVHEHVQAQIKNEIWTSSWLHAEALQVLGTLVFKIMLFVALHYMPFVNVVADVDMTNIPAA